MKKRLTLTLGTVLALTMCANAQWTPITPYGGGYGDAAGSFVINNKMYLMGGVNPGGATAEIYMLNPATDSWTQMADIGGGRARAWGFTFAINGKGYFVGGDSTTNFTVSDDVFEYDPTNDTWTQKADFPNGPLDGGFAFVLNNKAYIGCGYDGTNVVSDVWEYDPATDTWTSLGNFPGGALIFPSSFVVNGKGYVVCGSAGFASEQTATYEFDPATKMWTQKADFPGAARQTAIGFASATDGYVAGGQSSYTTTYTDVWKYNPGIDAWSKLNDLPYPETGWLAGNTIGGTAYVGTGVKFSSSGLIASSNFYKYALPVSVNGLANKHAKLRIYPNPVVSTINIDGELPQGAIITIYNTLGMKVKVAETGNRINVQQLPAGNYILHVTDNTLEYRQMFTKQ